MTTKQIPADILAALEVAGEKAVLEVEWKGDDYGARKRYYHDMFMQGAQTAYELGVAQGKVEALVFTDHYTDGAYAGIKAELELREAELASLLARLREGK